MFAKHHNYSSFAVQRQVFDKIEGYPNRTPRFALARGASPMGLRTQWFRELGEDCNIFISSNTDNCPRREIAGKLMSMINGERVNKPGKTNFS